MVILKIYIYMGQKISLYNLCEYVYDAIIKKGNNFLFDRLDREDYLKVRSASKIKYFAEHSYLDDIFIMLSKIGIGVGIVLWDKEAEKQKKVQDVLIAYNELDTKDVTKQIIKDKVFSSVDLDIIKGLQTISKSSNSSVYGINRKYLAIKDYAFKPRTLVTKLEAERNLDWYSKTIDFALNINQELEAFKINDVQFKVLVYLHTCPNGATKDNLKRKLSKTHINEILTPMYQMNMVSIDENTVSIAIYGLMVIEKIYNKFP